MILKVFFPYDVSYIDLTEDSVSIKGYNATLVKHLDEKTSIIHINGKDFLLVHDGNLCAFYLFRDFKNEYNYHHLGLWKIPVNNSLFAEVSKNACSTIVSEIYNKFYSTGAKKYTPNGEWIWPTLTKEERSKMNLDIYRFLFGNKSEYGTIFFIYDDPIKRFIRAINDKYIKHHRILSYLKPPYDENIETFIDKCILLTRLNIFNYSTWDQHIVPIHKYHKDIMPFVTDIVNLKDLTPFMKEKFDIEPQRYYVSKEHVITYDNLNEKQINMLKYIYQQDYLIPTQYADKFYK